MISSTELLDKISKKLEVNDYSLENFDIKGPSSFNNISENSKIRLDMNGLGATRCLLQEDFDICLLLCARKEHQIVLWVFRLQFFLQFFLK